MSIYFFCSISFFLYLLFSVWNIVLFLIKENLVRQRIEIEGNSSILMFARFSFFLLFFFVVQLKPITYDELIDWMGNIPIHLILVERNRKWHFGKCCFIFSCCCCCYWLKNKHRNIPCKHETFHIKSNPIQSNECNSCLFYRFSHDTVLPCTQRVPQCM